MSAPVQSTGEIGIPMAAILAGVSYWTVLGWGRTGKVRIWKTIEGHWRVDRASLDAYLESQATAS